MCFISIIIPTFNAGSTISSCLTTLLRQSFKDFEILIQDGGSTDNTLDLISNINDNRIKVISEKDKGVYDAMNKALLRSSGEWFYFLGSDDSLFSENILDIISVELRKTSASLVYGDVKLIGENGILKGDIDDIYRGFTSVDELIFDNICHQAIFYKSSIFNEDNWRYELQYNVQADHILNIKLASIYPFRYIPLVIANFKHGGISTQVIDSYFSKDIGCVLIQYFGYQLLNNRFYRSKTYIKKGAIKFLSKRDFSPGIKGYIIYLVLKLSHLFKVK